MASQPAQGARSASASVPPERLQLYLNLEESVRVWIETVLKVPLKGDLMEALKSGIVLCYLMRQLDENSIPRIQEMTPLVPMLAQENIAFFLAASADYGISAHRRFFMLDLWNGNNRPRVIHALAELARIAVAKKFPIGLTVCTYELNKMPHPLPQEELQKVTEHLSKMRMVRESVSANAAPVPRDASGIFKRKLEYLVSQQEFPAFERRWTRIQALIRGRAARQKFQQKMVSQAFRDKIAYELRDTETSYVSSLKVLISKYLIPLQIGSWNKKLILPPATIKTLFGDIETIYGVNKVLNKSIDKAMETWGPATQLGKIFVSIMDFLKIYASYVSNTDAQLREYDHLLKTNKLFAQFVEETRNSAPGMLDIPGYLIMPIQRVPRYFMLVERLTKHTWKDHVDYANLEKSSRGLQAVAMHLNEQKRKFENIRSVMVFQSSILGCPTIVQPTRRFVFQCELWDSKRKDEWLLLLFNDSLLLAKIERKKGASTSKFKDHYIFPDVDIIFTENHESSAPPAPTQDAQNAPQTGLAHIIVGGASVLKLSSSPDAVQLVQRMNEAKQELKAIIDSKSGTHGEETESSEDSLSELDVDADASHSISAEDLLKQRELEKKQLKAKMAEEMKLLEQPASTAPTASSTPPTAANTPGPVVATSKTALRSTASLLKMKAIVEQQIEVLDTHVEKEGHNDEYRRMASNLSEELAELDNTLEQVKGGLSPEVLEAVNQEESAVRLQVSEEPNTMKSKKKPRKSLFSFFGSSGRSSPGPEHSSPSSSAKTLTVSGNNASGSPKPGSPSGSTKLRHSAKMSDTR